MGPAKPQNEGQPKTMELPRHGSRMAALTALFSLCPCVPSMSHPVCISGIEPVPLILKEVSVAKKKDPDLEARVIGAAVGGAIGGVIGAIVAGPIGAALGAAASSAIGHEIANDAGRKGL